MPPSRKGKGKGKGNVDEEPTEGADEPAPARDQAHERDESAVGRFAALHPAITSAVVVALGILGGFVWISGKFDDIRDRIDDKTGDVQNEVADVKLQVGNLKTDIAKMSTKLDEHERRLTVIETKLGIGDAGIPDAASDASMDDVWPTGHAERRDKFCLDKCKADAACIMACASAYNLCGINQPSDPLSDTFRACVKAIK